MCASAPPLPPSPVLVSFCSHSPDLIGRHFSNLFTPPRARAVWVATGASSLTEKYLAMVLPVSAFVAFGAEHSVQYKHLFCFILRPIVYGFSFIPMTEDGYVDLEKSTVK